MARKGRPDSRDSRDKRVIQAKLVTGGTEATPDNRVTRVIQEIRDERATPAIEASPLHAPRDSITILILATEGKDVWRTKQ
jgi:hypothetical protein